MTVSRTNGKNGNGKRTNGNTKTAQNNNNNNNEQKNNTEIKEEIQKPVTPEKPKTGCTKEELTEKGLIYSKDNGNHISFTEFGRQVGFRELVNAHKDAGYESTHYIKRRLRRFGWIEKVNSRISITSKSEAKIFQKWIEKGVDKKSYFEAQNGEIPDESKAFDPFNLTPKKSKKVTKVDEKNSASFDF